LRLCDGSKERRLKFRQFHNFVKFGMLAMSNKRKWNAKEARKYNHEFGRLMSEKYPEWLDDDTGETAEKLQHMWLGYCLDKSPIDDASGEAAKI
jgi:hypothetical protein